jgi:hypothetical protein
MPTLNVSLDQSYALIANTIRDGHFFGEKRIWAEGKFDIRCPTFDQRRLFRPGSEVRNFEEKMLRQIGPESLTVAFKHWQNLAVGTVLMAFSAYLTISAKSFVTTTTQHSKDGRC